MKKILLFVLFLTLVYIQKSYSQNRWIYITTSTNDYTIYYDSESIKINGNEITIFLKFIPSSSSKDYYRINYSIDKWILYCNRNQYQEVFSVEYLNSGNSSTNYLYLYSDVIPESIGEKIYNTFCN
jgi:hypothetical protein